MYGEMMQYYGLVKDLDKADYFETEAFKSVLHSLEAAVMSGGIITLTGIVGVGKTRVIRHFQDGLKKNNQVVVAKSLATDKRRVNINTLYTALFADLPTPKDFKIITQTETRERKLQELIRKINKPIAFFIDGAHDLHWRTLISIKQLIETVEDTKGTLTVIMVGHPKLGNDLNKPTMEEIGARAKLFSLDSWGQQKERYIEWVLTHCSKPKTAIHDIVTPDAINLLAERLITPLQICHYLTLAFIKGATTGTKPVDVEIVETILSPDLNTLEPKLARHGYNTTALCEHLNARRGEIKAYFNGQLPAARAEDFNKEIHKLGIL
ncbi:AAA family ATPase [Methylomonas sp. SURF-1]|uniref:AAA family ATPase n=2 Tax=Methylomonas TaxID=416 RepID=A0ABT1TKE8_9GAMM|nr:MULTISPECIES: AAA family ATPase [unclassified Methylomonas]MCQ8105943.1 AAA family ATPase [Methylomonas sp. SURF-2]MCQ8182733.1 AAA family ATPase [Methylomonas sp. SURF-1]